MMNSYKMRLRLNPNSEYRAAALVISGLVAGNPGYKSCWEQLRPALQNSESFDFVEIVEGNLD